MNTKSHDQREAEQLAILRTLLPTDTVMNGLSDLSSLPVLRKDALLKAQSTTPPFGAIKTRNVANIYQSPGPIYEPGGSSPDWWRFGRFLAAMGLGQDDIVQNTFAYHFTPAGAMFESAAKAVGATVFPAGPGQTRQQAEVAAAIGTTTYAGTPDYLGAILAKGDELGLDLSRINKAAVSAGPLFPQLRAAYLDRGITCRQCYGTADVGLIAYETADCIDGMFIDDGVIVEIVTPGTGTPVPHGEIGEVLVTVLNPDYPLIRFSVGDLSAIMPDAGPVKRIVGWRGRADQAAKVKGMFI
ncbi:MAG: AMP-binding protein, partial [Yoonia sp.]